MLRKFQSTFVIILSGSFAKINHQNHIQCWVLVYAWREFGDKFFLVVWSVVVTITLDWINHKMLAGGQNWELWCSPHLEDCRGSAQLVLPPVVSLLTPQPGGDVPETHVGALRLRHDQIKLVRLALEFFNLIGCQIHQMVDLLLKPRHSLITVGCSRVAMSASAHTHPGSPLEPQFEDVVMSAALDHFVSGVVADVVALVGLEEIVGRHLVTTDEQSLNRFIWLEFSRPSIKTF